MTSEEVSFKRIKLKDESGTVEIGLWREMAESQVKEGDYVALNNFYVTSRYHKEKRSQIPILASQKKNSSVQVRSIYKSSQHKVFDIKLV